MASRSKNKTTFAKLAREGRLRERRIEKQAKKEARKRAAENPQAQPEDTPLDEDVNAGSGSSANDV
ncbi:MAG TPA: hypothetical protein VGL78_01025 [Solirubrobacteraceae bacterium]|jgi:hypothetical protein